MNFIALDLETTGLNPLKDHIIEVAIVRFGENGEILDRWSSLVKPSVSIPTFTTRLTGIDNSMVKDAPTLNELRDTILEKIGDLPILGHFIFFDVNFLIQKGFDLKNKQLDTCQITQVLIPNEPSYSLEVLAQKLNIKQDDAHRALHDVLANIDLYKHIKQHVLALSTQEKLAIKPLLEKSVWPWADVMLSWLESNEEGVRMPKTERTWAVQTESKIKLSEITPAPPFLVQEASHNLKDLLDYALSLGEPSLLVVPNLKLCPEAEDVFILKNPSDYVSPKRLELFLSDEELSEVKTMLGVKIVLELSQNESGEKSQFRLFKDEVPAWFEICGQEEDPGLLYETKLKEALQKKVLVVSHHHFLSSTLKKTRLPTRPVTVVAAVEAWLSQIETSWHLRVSEARFLHSIVQLRRQNPEQSDHLNALAGQISIFFGFMGMALRRYGEANADHHLWNVEAHDRNTMEWNKIIKSIQSIENSALVLSNELKESVTKQEFLDSIGQVRQIIEMEGPVLWLTMGEDEQIMVHSFPENTRQMLTEQVWTQKTKWHLFAHHIDLDDEAAFIKKELALPDSIPVSFNGSMKGWPLYATEAKIPSPNDPQNNAKVTAWVRDHLGTWEGNIFLLLSAKHTAEQFFYSLVKPAEASGYELFVQNLSGGMGKIMKMAEKKPDHNLFVGNADFLQFLLNEGVHLQTLIVQRLPFSHPKDPITQARSRGLTDAYRDFALPYMKLQNRMLLDSFLGDEWKGKAIYMLDSRG